MKGFNAIGAANYGEHDTFYRSVYGKTRPVGQNEKGAQKALKQRKVKDFFSNRSG